MPCPDNLTLSVYEDGGLAPTESARLEDHLRACSSCFRQWERLRALRWGTRHAQGAADRSDVEMTPDPMEVSSRLDSRIRSIFTGKKGISTFSNPPKMYLSPFSRIAAAVLLAAGAFWGAVHFGIVPKSDDVPSAFFPPSPSGRGAGGEGSSSKLVFRDLTPSRVEPLSDSLRLEIADGARADWRRTPDGDGWRIRVDDGSVRVHVRPGAEPVSVQTPAGSVEVLGTVFQTDVLTCRLPGVDAPAFTGTRVTVWEGKVALRNPHGRVLLEGGGGTLIDGQSPLLQTFEDEITPAGLRSILEGLNQSVKSGDLPKARTAWFSLMIQKDKLPAPLSELMKQDLSSNLREWCIRLEHEVKQ